MGVVVVDLSVPIDSGVVVLDVQPGLYVFQQVAVGFGAHHAADAAVARAGDSTLFPLGPDNTLPVGGPVLGPIGKDGLMPLLGGAVHLHLAGNAHPDVILAEEGGQHVHDLGADAVLHALLELELQRRDFAVQGVLRQVDVADGIGNADGVDLQPLHAVSHQIPDGLGLLVGEQLALHHSHADGGGGLHHVAAVQYVCPVLSGRNVHGGIHHVGEIADRRRHLILQVLNLGVAPFLTGGECAQVLHVVVAGLVQVRHEDAGLQRRLLPGGNHNGVPVLHPVVRNALLAQEVQDIGRLGVADLGDQHGVVLLIQRQHDGGGHDKGHQNSGDDQPDLFRYLFQALLRLAQERPGLFLHVVQPLSPPSLRRAAASCRHDSCCPGPTVRAAQGIPPSPPRFRSSSWSARNRRPAPCSAAGSGNQLLSRSLCRRSLPWRGYPAGR